MKSFLFVLIILCSFTAILAQFADKEIRHRLLGQWSANHTFDEISVSGTSFFGTDGMAYFDGTIRGIKDVSEYHVSARWHISGGRVVTQVVESTIPEIFPLGATEIDSVVALNDSIYSYIDKNGELLTDKKIPY